MIKLIIKRLAIAIPTLIIIIAFVFGLMRLAPGGPFTNERALPPEIEQKINEAYDLIEMHTIVTLRTSDYEN